MKHSRSCWCSNPRYNNWPVRSNLIVLLWISLLFQRTDLDAYHLSCDCSRWRCRPAIRLLQQWSWLPTYGSVGLYWGFSGPRGTFHQYLHSGCLQETGHDSNYSPWWKVGCTSSEYGIVGRGVAQWSSAGVSKAWVHIVGVSSSMQLSSIAANIFSEFRLISYFQLGGLWGQLLLF